MQCLWVIRSIKFSQLNVKKRKHREIRTVAEGFTAGGRDWLRSPVMDARCAVRDAPLVVKVRSQAGQTCFFFWLPPPLQLLLVNVFAFVTRWRRRGIAEEGGCDG